jgi:hypothetical protein
MRTCTTAMQKATTSITRSTYNCCLVHSNESRARSRSSLHVTAAIENYCRPCKRYILYGHHHSAMAPEYDHDAELFAFMVGMR